MRVLSKLLAGSAAAAIATFVVAAPALADPPSGVTPKATDIVGVGSDTSESLYDQFSHDYNSKKPGSKLYSWDATNPNTGAVNDPIVTKAGCASIERPDGSNAGITALDQNTADGSNFCIDYVRTARGRAATDPPYSTGGIAFTSLAEDALTYATRNAASGGTNAPANLSSAQLKNIYLCKTTNWDKVGGSAGTIQAFLPQVGAGLRTAFLTALGGGTTPITPGSCVNSTVQQNQGVDPLLNTANSIVPYSTAKFIAEYYHSAACANTSCTPVNGVICTPKNSQNLYGCDEHGVLGLNKINDSAPAKPWPLPASVTAKPTLNPSYTRLFLNPIYTVVRYAATSDHIPAYLEPVFGASGWACTNATAKADLKNYGFLAVPSCGATS